MPESVVRISPEAKKLIEEIAEKTGRSVSQLVSEAIFKVYAGVDKALEQALDKKVVDIKTETFRTKTDKLHCSICKRNIHAGELVTVITITYEDNTLTKLFYCYNCYMSETISDEKLLKLEKQLYELRRVKRLLEGEKKKLLDEVSKLEKIVHNLSFLTELELLVRELLARKELSDEDKKKLFEFEQKAMELHAGTKLLIEELVKKKQKEEARTYEVRKEWKRW